MSGLEYISNDLSTHPQCVHGPTLLFSRTINENGDRRNFYACSACRDRKQCSFFQWEDETVKKSVNDNNSTLLEERKKLIPSFDQMESVLKEIQQIPANKRCYCHTCTMLVLPKNRNKHNGHDLKCDISNHELLNPSSFLKPLNNDKKEAQYLFSKSAIKVTVEILQSLSVRKVLCIGAPRIHEYIQSNKNSIQILSLLLDLDQRFHLFFSQEQFCFYNLFNHYFFTSKSKDVYFDFLQRRKSNEKLAIVIDPPFGGRIEPIAQTLENIQHDYNKLNTSDSNELPVLFYFPYFMEPQIRNSLSNYQMADYKVDYDNHPLFQDGMKGRKYGSPVRIFTNVDLSKIQLPESEGYEYCESCKRWTYDGNDHCTICNACTSKDGRTYIHCQLCNRCVKPTWKHCIKCERCAQPDHVCGEQLIFNQTCFHCKERGHKKTNCPRVNHEQIKRKRLSKMERRKKQNVNV